MIRTTYNNSYTIFFDYQKNSFINISLLKFNFKLNNFVFHLTCINEKFFIENMKLLAMPLYISSFYISILQYIIQTKWLVSIKKINNNVNMLNIAILLLTALDLWRTGLCAPSLNQFTRVLSWTTSIINTTRWHAIWCIGSIPNLTSSAIGTNGSSTCIICCRKISCTCSCTEHNRSINCHWRIVKNLHFWVFRSYWQGPDGGGGVKPGPGSGQTWGG